MKRLRMIFLHMARGISGAVRRFPLTVLALSGATGLVWYLIGIDEYPAPLLPQKWIFTLVVGAFLGMAAQFASERFEKLQRRRLPLYGAAALLAAAYFFVLLPAPEIGSQIVVRSLVAVFALFCVTLVVPSWGSFGRKAAEQGAPADFDRVAMTHFKSFFTALLYSGVLAAGLAAIIFAVDFLLVPLDDDMYGYMMATVWILFAPLYFLSLLPDFNAAGENAQALRATKSEYPRFLEILISYIAVPLFTAYTLVLLAYFVKILATREWPSGQLGPMILAYSAIGILLFILCAIPENRVAHWYRMLFPKVLLPVVAMQLVAVYIRVAAYGITESRYYILLFGIYSLVTGVFLSFRPAGKNGVVVLLAAIFAVVSILPPVDAFSVSRNSQIGLLETYLTEEGVLSGETVTPRTGVPEDVRIEVTSKLEYLSRTGALSYVEWLPEDFNLYDGMEPLLGFAPAYAYYGEGPSQEYFYVQLDLNKPVAVTGADVMFQVEGGRYNVGKTTTFDFTVDGVDYVLESNSVDKDEMVVTVKDSGGRVLVSTGFRAFSESIQDVIRESKNQLPPEDLLFEVEENGCRMQILFQSIDMTLGAGDTGTMYRAFVYFDAP